MSQQVQITSVRRQLLSLPGKLGPGEKLDVMRHNKKVLTIIRAEEETPNPFAELQEASQLLARPSAKERNPPRTLAVHYKKFLYGKKK